MTALPNDSNLEWVPDSSHLSNRLAMLRHAMGWNMKEAAVACGIAPQSWRDWEDGGRPADYEGTCAKLADRTGCDLVWLMTGYIKPGMIRLLPRMSSSGDDQVSDLAEFDSPRRLHSNLRLVLAHDSTDERQP